MDFKLPAPWRCALDIVRMDFPDAVIAGGALRDLILGREPKDIDVFAFHPKTLRSFDSSGPYHVAAMDIKHWGARYLGPTKCVINDAWAEYNDAMYGVVCAVEIDAALTRPLPIQLITMSQPVTLLSAVERIDFGICRVSHDGDRLFVHNDFEHDRVNECFTMRRPSNEAQRVRSYARHERLMAKYPGWPMIEEIFLP